MSSRKALLVVLCFFALVFVIKFLILDAYIFPPSEDGAGDIQHAHEWMNLQLNGDINALPPLYYLFEVIPILVTVGSPFLALKLIMALAPSMLIPATYLAMRKFHASTFASVLGALFMGMSTVFANMSTWNSGFDLFGILFMIPAIGYYYEAFETKARRPVILGALFTALTAGSHQLAFMTLILVLLGFGTLEVLKSRDRQTVKTFLGLYGLSALFSLPFVPFYLNAVHQSVGVGFSPNLIGSAWTVLEQAVFTAWGINANIVSAVDFVWVVIFAVMLWKVEKGNGRFLLLMGVLFAVSLLGVVYNSENWIRSFFFEAIPSVFIFAKGFSAFIRKMPAAYRTLSFVFLLMLVVGNFAYSTYSFDAGIQYYSFFCTVDNNCNQVVDNYTSTLSWMQAHPIPPSANRTVYSTFMVTWIEAVTGDTGMGTYDLDGRLTSYSYDSSFASAMIYFGLYDLGDQFYNIGISGPGQNTTVYVSYGGFWQPVLSLDPKSMAFVVNGTEHILSDASLVGVVGDSNSTAAEAQVDYRWADGFQATETLSVNGPVFRVDLVGQGCHCQAQVVHIHSRNRLFAGSTSQLTCLCGKEAVFDLTQGTNSFSLRLQSGQGAPSLSSRNSTLGFSSQLSLNVSGDNLSPNAGEGYFVDSSGLIQAYSIQYFVISDLYDSLLYSNLQSQPSHFRTVFQSGDVVVVENLGA